MNHGVRCETAIVPIENAPLLPAREERRLRFLRIAPRTYIVKAPGDRLRRVLVFGCAVAAALVLLGPDPLYRSEATLVLSGEGTGAGASLEGARIVLAYLESRDAAGDLADRLALPPLLAPPGLDPVSRLLAPRNDAPLGTLAAHLQGRLEADLDERSGHVRVRFDAHRPVDAREALAGLLAGAEALVNRMGAAARSRRIAAAVENVEEAEGELRRILSTRAAWQARTRHLDPRAEAERDAVLADRLRSEGALLAVDRARLAALAPDSPRLAALDERARALRAAGGAEGAANAEWTKAVAALAADDSLKLSRTLAVQALEAAHRRLELAFNAERAERIFLATIAEPSLPDRPRLRPQGWQLVLAAIFAATAALLSRRRTARPA